MDIRQMDPNWVAAIGQVLGALFTAVAAWIALATARTARDTAERGVAATERQTAVGVIQDILNDYAGPEMYNALRCFGRFVGNDERRKALFARMTEQFRKSGRRLDLDTARGGDFAWAVQEMERDVELGAARRRIHHHFKRIWALRQAGVISDPDLLLVTEANYGYDLWRDEVLPVTVALGLTQQARGRPSAASETWPYELIDWVENAARRHPAGRVARGRGAASTG